MRGLRGGSSCLLDRQLGRNQWNQWPEWRGIGGRIQWNTHFNQFWVNSIVQSCDNTLTATSSFGGSQVSVGVSKIPGCKNKEIHGISEDGRIVVMTDTTTLLVNSDDSYYSQNWSPALFGWGDAIVCDNYLIYEESLYRQNETVKIIDLTQCLMLLVDQVYFDGNVVKLSNNTFWKIMTGNDYVKKWKKSEGIVLCQNFIIGSNYENVQVVPLKSLEDYNKSITITPILPLLLGRYMAY